MIYYIGLLIITLELIGLAAYVRNIGRVERENMILESNISQAELYYTQLKDRTDSVRKFRHDLQKHIRIVEHFLARNREWRDYEEYRQLQECIDKMKEDITGIQQNIYCEDELVDAICQIINDRCSESNVSFTAEISAGKEELDKVDSYHLTGILMNLLDNALEACKLCKDSRPACMKLEICREPDGFSVSVGNNVPDSFDMSFRTTKADKDIHGIGLGIARDYAALYKGTLEYHFDQEDHYLTIRTVLMTPS